MVRQPMTHTTHASPVVARELHLCTHRSVLFPLPPHTTDLFLSDEVTTTVPVSADTQA